MGADKYAAQSPAAGTGCRTAARPGPREVVFLRADHVGNSPGAGIRFVTVNVRNAWQC